MKKNLTQNLIGILVFSLFFSFSSYFFSWEYIDFQTNNQEQNQANIELKKSLQDFSQDEIQEIQAIEIYDTPDVSLIKKIQEKIDMAQKRVYLNVYIYTEKNIRASLLKAQKRGLDVKIILEKNVYMAPNLNKQVFDEAEKAGIAIVWSNPKNYTFNHAKYLLVDDEIILSTGNISYTNFKTNRDIFLFIKEKEILSKIEEIFKRDFAGEKKIISHKNLLVSPYSSREKIEYLLKNAKRTIRMYAPYIEDVRIFTLLKERLKSWVLLTIITSDKEGKYIKELEKNGGNIIYSKRKIHAKAILKDEDVLFIGSVNFSKTSMDENMELGILIKEKKIIADFIDFFQKGL